MNTRNLATIAAGLLLAGTLAYAVQMDSRVGTPTPAYQGQNTGTFQMYFSPAARQDTFLVDSAGGRVWALRSSGDRTVFDQISVAPAPAGGSSPGRFRVYFGASRVDTFLLDTVNGQTWTLTQNDSTNRPMFSAMTVQ